MSSISWWRSWHGAPTDHKWQVIAARSCVKVGIVSAIAWALLDHASQHKDRGCVDGFDVETYAVYSGFDETEITAVLKAMTDKGIIQDGRLANWEKRQPKREDETSTQRVREWREMKRSETQCNTKYTPDTDIDDQIQITNKDKEIYIHTDEHDSFETTRRWIEKFTGYPPMPEDLKAIREMVLVGVIEDDVKQAVEYFVSQGKTARGANNILKSVMFSAAKRIQSGVKSNGGKPREPTTIKVDFGEGAEERTI